MVTIQNTHLQKAILFLTFAYVVTDALHIKTFICSGL